MEKRSQSGRLTRNSPLSQERFPLVVNDQSGDRINPVPGNLDNPLFFKDIPGFDMGNLLLAISIQRSGRADHLCPVCHRDADERRRCLFQCYKATRGPSANDRTVVRSLSRLEKDGEWIPRAQPETCVIERSFWQLVELVVFRMEESKCHLTEANISRSAERCQHRHVLSQRVGDR